jgi:hypothetical protein
LTSTLAAAGVLATLSPALAVAQDVYTLTGQITDAEALAFSVLNGNLLNANPQSGDLPLGYTATLTIDDTANEATFDFGGGFTSPTRAYTFDVSVSGLEAGLTDTPTALTITDVFADFDFSLSLDKTTGLGSFSWLAPGAVPTSPAGDRSAEGTIASFTFVPEPSTALLLGAGGLVLMRRGRDR